MKMHIERFNDTVDRWINDLTTFTLSELLIKPVADSWSLGQLYIHIIEESGWYNAQIEVSLLDTENAGCPTTEMARKLFEEKSFADKIITGDPLIAENVPQPVSIVQIQTGLEQLKKATNNVWRKMSKAQSFGKSEHPGIGYLNCFEWLQYSEMHMRHHLKQKSRIVAFLHSQAR